MSTVHVSEFSEVHCTNIYINYSPEEKMSKDSPHINQDLFTLNYFCIFGRYLRNNKSVAVSSQNRESTGDGFFS